MHEHLFTYIRTVYWQSDLNRLPICANIQYEHLFTHTVYIHIVAVGLGLTANMHKYIYKYLFTHVRIVTVGSGPTSTVYKYINSYLLIYSGSRTWTDLIILLMDLVPTPTGASAGAGAGAAHIW